MKTLITLILTTAAIFAQTKAKVVINVTDDAGNTVTARITGQPAASGLEILRKWLATQQTCTQIPAVAEVKDAEGNVTTPAVAARQDCKPKFENEAEFIKTNLIDQTEAWSEQGFSSSAVKPEEDALKAAQDALKAKKKQAFAAARAEKGQ